MDQEKKRLFEPITEDSYLLPFTKRQRKEIAFARLYARDFGHGTSGHNALIIISRLADMLRTVCQIAAESESDEQTGQKIKRLLGWVTFLNEGEADVKSEDSESGRPDSGR